MFQCAVFIVKSTYSLEHIAFECPTPKRHNINKAKRKKIGVNKICMSTIYWRDFMLDLLVFAFGFQNCILYLTFRRNGIIGVDTKWIVPVNNLQ